MQVLFAVATVLLGLTTFWLLEFETMHVTFRAEVPGSEITQWELNFRGPNGYLMGHAAGSYGSLMSMEYVIPPRDGSVVIRDSVSGMAMSDRIVPPQDTIYIRPGLEAGRFSDLRWSGGRSLQVHLPVEAGTMKGDNRSSASLELFVVPQQHWLAEAAASTDWCYLFPPEVDTVASESAVRSQIDVLFSTISGPSVDVPPRRHRLMIELPAATRLGCQWARHPDPTLGRYALTAVVGDLSSVGIAFGTFGALHQRNLQGRLSVGPTSYEVASPSIVSMEGPVIGSLERRGNDLVIEWSSNPRAKTATINGVTVLPRRIKRLADFVGVLSGSALLAVWVSLWRLAFGPDRSGRRDSEVIDERSKSN
jgi:hypothetical protein